MYEGVPVLELETSTVPPPAPPVLELPVVVELVGRLGLVRSGTGIVVRSSSVLFVVVSVEGACIRGSV